MITSKMLVAAAVLLALVLLYSIFGYSARTKALGLANISVNGRSYYAYLATTQAQWAQGLMNRTSIGDCDGFGNCIGMLFIFPNGSNACFWMKNTQIPLRQYWIMNNTIYVAFNGVPESMDTVCHEGDWVLETNANSNVSVGQRVSINKILT